MFARLTTFADPFGAFVKGANDTRDAEQQRLLNEASIRNTDQGTRKLSNFNDFTDATQPGAIDNTNALNNLSTVGAKAQLPGKALEALALQGQRTTGALAATSGNRNELTRQNTFGLTAAERARLETRAQGAQFKADFSGSTLQDTQNTAAIPSAGDVVRSGQQTQLFSDTASQSTSALSVQQDTTTAAVLDALAAGAPLSAVLDRKALDQRNAASIQGSLADASGAVNRRIENQTTQPTIASSTRARDNIATSQLTEQQRVLDENVALVDLRSQIAKRNIDLGNSNRGFGAAVINALANTGIAKTLGAQERSPLFLENQFALFSKDILAKVDSGALTPSLALSIINNPRQFAGFLETNAFSSQAR